MAVWYKATLSKRKARGSTPRSTKNFLVRFVYNFNNTKLVLQ